MRGIDPPRPWPGPPEDEEQRSRTVPAPARRRSRRRLFLLGAAVAALVAAAVVVVFPRVFEPSGGGTLFGPPTAAFRVTYPAGWRPLRQDEPAALRSTPLAALSREGDTGFVVIRSAKRARGDMAPSARELARELSARLLDFKHVREEIVAIGGRRAFLFTYVREQARTVHSIVVVPHGSRSYVIYTLAPAGAREAAREIGAIISSFSPGR